MSVNRATLPSEFYDITSAELLQQPEPQYFHAALGFTGLMKAELDTVGPVGMPGRTAGDQGAQYGGWFQRVLAEPGELAKFGEAIKVVTELGKAPGHTVRMNRPQFSGGGYSEAARRITPTATISTTPIDLSAEQVSITIERYVGPFAVAGTVPQPYAVDRFDATMSIHSLASVVGLHMRRDYSKWLDTVLKDRYDVATNISFPTGIVADVGITGIATDGLTFEHLTRVQQALKDRFIPTFANGRYMAVLHPAQTRQLANDAPFQRLAVFMRDVNPVFPGYFASITGLDIFESSTLTSTATGGGGATVLRGQAFGPNAVGWGIGESPRVMPSTDDNYGETVKVVWILYGGFQTLDQRFIQSIRTGAV